MRIHTSVLTMSDIHEAARVARVDFGRLNEHGSRTRARAFDVTLTGESRRRPNDRGSNPGAYAATWDQWGVFLAVLFDRDPAMVTPYYSDRDDFERKTAYRFHGGTWPVDAHGDHDFRFNGIGISCTKCSARQVR